MTQQPLGRPTTKLRTVLAGAPSASPPLLSPVSSRLVSRLHCGWLLLLLLRVLLVLVLRGWCSVGWCVGLLGRIEFGSGARRRSRAAGQPGRLAHANPNVLSNVLTSPGPAAAAGCC